MSAQADRVRRRAHRAEAAFAVAVVLAAAALFAVQAGTLVQTGGGHPTAVIARDGEVMQTIDLAAVEEPFELRFEDARGVNVVQVEPGRIRIAEADCPDGVCVRAGWIDAPGKVAACVPHGLTITVDGQAAGGDGEEAEGGIDAVTR
ncbi:NusG domain II-containing protein [Arabiibacter massiliensis]|uniref:NusG domain II-containing protein n=1 Tax=Arabiibacter massiliensis TaxID=1870985 RepID=UPI001E5D1D0E|nr:NusG domain II-containing protein [Arabiibacter massiliensis]